MAVTLQKIAELTGTSPATVSRALRGNSRISQSTRDRIIEVAKQFRYQPNLVARSMVNGKTQSIGLVVPMTGSGPFSRVVSGVETAARARGYSVVLCQTEFDDQILEEHLHLLACRRTDGLLLCPHRQLDFNLECLNKLGSAKNHPPIVLLQEPLEQSHYPSVMVDNRDGGRQLGEHLLQLGHKHIGFIALDENRAGLERYEGYRDAYIQAGIDPGNIGFTHVKLTDPLAIKDEALPEVDTRWLSQLLEDNPQWTALAIEHDLLAIVVMHGLKKIKRRVPDDIAVVGFDDVPVVSIIDPPLTTARQPSHEIGVAACNLLLDQLTNVGKTATPRNVLVPCQLRVRASCGVET